MLSNTFKYTSLKALKQNVYEMLWKYRQSKILIIESRHHISEGPQLTISMTGVDSTPSVDLFSQYHRIL